MRNQKRRKQPLENLYLSPDLWREVLVRLPSKSLLQFRCVCKDWCSLIDSHDFITANLNLYRNNSAKTQLFAVERVPKTSSDFVFRIRRSDTFRKIGQVVRDSEARMIQNSYMVDGLMMMHNCDYSISDLDELSLWNPSIRKSLVLPRCPLNCFYLHYRAFLGFAPSRNDYEVVVFGDCNHQTFEMSIAIYSLRDHLWRLTHEKIHVSRWCYEKVQGRGAVYSQGALYWAPGYFRWPGDDTEFLSYVFDAKEFRTLKLPDMQEEMCRYLFLFGGSVAFFGITRMRSCIWVMETTQVSAGNEMWRKCWEKNTNADVYKFIRECTMSDYQILYIEDTGKLLLQCYKNLMAYNIRSNEARYLGKSVPLSYVETYVESLVLHKGFESEALSSVV